MKNKLLCVCMVLLLAAPAQAFDGETEGLLLETEEPVIVEIVPEDGELPVEEELPTDGELSTGEELPDEGELSTGEELPTDGELPNGEELPAGEEFPADGELPAGEELSVEELPAETESPALAADELPGDSTVVRVLVPDTGRVVVNPYRLKVQAGSGESREQIVHEAQPLTNLSDIPVSVNVQAMGIIPAGSRARFVSAPPPADAPGKDVFMYAEFRNRPDDWTGAYTGGYGQLAVTESGSSADAVMELEPQGEGYFRLFGAASASPAEVWTAEDTVDVTFAFTFVPVGDTGYVEPEEFEESEESKESEEFGEPEDTADAQDGAENTWGPDDTEDMEDGADDISL